MKQALAILFTLLCLKLSAQTINGKVIDRTTRLPLKFIFVASSSGTAFTNNEGLFSLTSTSTDTVRINTMGYQPYKLAVGKWGSLMREIELEPGTIQLKEVLVTAKTNHFKDSVALRKEFAKQFNFSGPKFSDIMRPTSQNVPFAFVTLDIGVLLRALSKKNDPNYKLKQLLLKDESERHVTARFNKELVSRVTHLAGDSLEIFMGNFRPSTTILDKLSDYDLISYIKTRLQQFRATANSSDSLPILLKPGQSLE